MAVVKGKVLEKRVSLADSIEILSEDVQVQQECANIETPRCSKGDEDAVNQRLESRVDASNRSTWKRLIDKIRFKSFTPGQFFVFMVSAAGLIFRLRVSDKELLSEFCLVCSSTIVCVLITVFYERGYYAKTVFVDSYPREKYVDTPETLDMTQLKSSCSSSSSLYAKVLQSSSTSGRARALVHPPPPNLPESPTAISAYSDPRAIPGPSGLQRSP